MTGWIRRGAVAFALAASLRMLAPAETESLRDQIVEHINTARSSIDLVVYEIGSEEIAEALVEASRRGVRIRAIVDEERSSGNSPQEALLVDEGIPLKRVRLSQWKMLHDKFIIFDGRLAATPSYNQTAQKGGSSEQLNQAFTEDKTTLHQFHMEFQTLWNSTIRESISSP
jgi:phosphatidylserine/phosphatidylglycerophosphate/cardiolipin synthase-like enzyme